MILRTQKVKKCLQILVDLVDAPDHYVQDHHVPEYPAQECLVQIASALVKIKVRKNFGYLQ